MRIPPVADMVSVTPAGNAPYESKTPPWNPFNGVTPICVVPKPPGARLRELGDALRVKEGGGTVIVRASATDWTTVPPVAVMVSG